MSAEELLESLDRHFLVNPGLTAVQLSEHKRRDSCAQCDQATRAAQAVVRDYRPVSTEGAPRFP